MLPVTASPDLDVLQYLGRCVYVYQYMCVSIIFIQICPHPPVDQFCCWSIFVPTHKQLHGQAVCRTVGRKDGGRGEPRLNSDLLSGLLMYILMSSSMVSLGVQEPLVCCRDLGAFIPAVLETILFAMQLAFTAVLPSLRLRSLSL